MIHDIEELAAGARNQLSLSLLAVNSDTSPEEKQRLVTEAVSRAFEDLGRIQSLIQNETENA